MLDKSKQLTLKLQQPFAQHTLRQRRGHIRGGKSHQILLKSYTGFGTDFSARMAKLSGVVIECSQVLCPRKDAGQGKLLFEVVDIAQEVNPTPLVQTEMGVVPTVEIADHDAATVLSIRVTSPLLRVRRQNCRQQRSNPTYQ